MKLCFGQIIVPYKDGKTTSVMVARRLEKKYKLKQVFYNSNKKEIRELYRQATQDALNDAAHGVHRSKDLNSMFGKANDKTTQMFRDALNQQAFDGVVAGVATKRALMGISSRFKSGFATKVIKGKRVRVARPSFIDTQVYRNSSRTWIKE